MNVESEWTSNNFGSHFVSQINIKTHNFAILYITIPHNELNIRISDFIGSGFLKKNRGKILLISSDKSFKISLC
jgi:hypothetical protein